MVTKYMSHAANRGEPQKTGSLFTRGPKQVAILMPERGACFTSLKWEDVYGSSKSIGPSSHAGPFCGRGNSKTPQDVPGLFGRNALVGLQYCFFFFFKGVGCIWGDRKWRSGFRFWFPDKRPAKRGFTTKMAE